MSLSYKAMMTSDKQGCEALWQLERVGELTKNLK